MAGELMGILGRGAEGGFRGSREVAEGKIAASLDEKKAASIEKRQKSLARYSRMSGQYKEGHQLTQGELEEVPQEELGGILSTEEYKTGESEKAGAYEVSKSKREHGQTLELEKLKQKGKSEKPKSDIDKRKLYNTVYQQTLESMAGEPDAEEKAKKAASEISGFSPEEAQPETGSLADYINRVGNKQPGQTEKPEQAKGTGILSSISDMVKPDKKETIEETEKFRSEVIPDDKVELIGTYGPWEIGSGPGGEMLVRRGKGSGWQRPDESTYNSIDTSKIKKAKR